MRTADVAHFAYRVGQAELPTAVEKWSRWALLDTLSVLLAGHSTATARAATRTASRSPGDAQVTGRPVRTTAAMAAFADAVAANALDYEDGHYLGGGIHAGSTVVPALLAVAPPATSIGALRRAMVVGYEVAIRAGFLLSPKHSGQHYRASGHAASLGATAAVAALLELEPATIASSLRIAASHAPVSTMHAAGSCESIGWAAATAVTSVFLAIDGFSDEAPDSSLLAPVLPNVFDDEHAGSLAESLGTRYECLHCYVKPYACCRLIHAALDALSEIQARTALVPESIETIRVFTVSAGLTLDNRRPTTLEQAQFSIPVMVAVYLLHRRIGVDQSTSEIYRSEAVLSLADRVTVMHDPALEGRQDQSYPARVEVFAPLTFESETVLDASGSSTNPLGNDARLDKAQSCLRSALSTDAADRLTRLLLEKSGETPLQYLRDLAKDSAIGAIRI